ncbi:MAG: phosphoribosylformylglycinamidine synthase subunit PurQ [Vampirovibrio sp.]|nr:phosphoribosylformylglycinamidine synthase subunit PurQ [Vampirovibrio sp.]
MKVGIVVFPGSNCERDAEDAVRLYLKEEAVFLWHQEADLKGVEAVILPGGFSYGDYLRSGAISRFSPVMKSISEFAVQGRPVIGICNGFQALTESHLLPGALVKNTQLSFLCDRVDLIVENSQTPFSHAYQPRQTISLPVAHGEGNYVADPKVIEELEANNQVVFRYAEDVNGSVNRIAGICNKQGNVLGMMPHPERNLWPSEAWSGDGAGVFDSLKTALSQGLQTVAG